MKEVFESIGQDRQAVCDIYHRHACERSEINEHLPILMTFARMCSSVAEFGTGRLASTSAFARAFPEFITTFDVVVPAALEQFEEACRRAKVDFGFHKTCSMEATIFPHDMVFIDTRHNYWQLKTELEKHAPKAIKFLALHDTITFGHRDETGGGPGLRKAIFEYFAERGDEWKLIQEWPNNNGLMIFARRFFLERP